MVKSYRFASLFSFRPELGLLYKLAPLVQHKNPHVRVNLLKLLSALCQQSTTPASILSLKPAATPTTSDKAHKAASGNAAKPDGETDKPESGPSSKPAEAKGRRVNRSRGLIDCFGARTRFFVAQLHCEIGGKRHVVAGAKHGASDTEANARKRQYRFSIERLRFSPPLSRFSSQP